MPSPPNQPQMCPVCRANPELVKICAICHGKAEVVIAPGNGNEITITPIGEATPTFLGSLSKFPADFSMGFINATKKQTVAQGWDEFRAMCIPNVSEIQTSESRRVWYAALGWFLSILAHGLDAGLEPTADDLAYMGRVQAELEAFAVDLQEERA